MSKITQKYIQKAKILKERSKYMSQGVVKANIGYHLRGINRPINYSSFREDVVNGLSNEDYGLHSMRAGGYIMTTHLGVKEGLIKKYGRWKSDRVKDGYTYPP